MGKGDRMNCALSSDRCRGLDALKVAAILLVVNFHMGALYEEFRFLSTGGDIGNGLFFFCTGILLSSRCVGNFDDWYLRRLGRLCPSLVAWAFLANMPLRSALWGDGLWFVKCILIYYVAFFVVMRFFKNYLGVALCCSLIIVTFRWFTLIGSSNCEIYHGMRYWMWFPCMLLGAMSDTCFNRVRGYVSLLIAFASFITYNAVHYYAWRCPSFSWGLIVQIIPLMTLCLGLYYLFTSRFATRVLSYSWLLAPITFVSGLTFDIYITHFCLITTRLNSIFPLNIILVMMLMICLAWVNRVLGKLFAQILSREKHIEWRRVFDD